MTITTDTQVQKRMRGGWEALSRIPMEGKQFLEVHTYKGERGVVTFANVNTETDMGFSHMMFSDFNKRLNMSQISGTEKNIRAQHAMIMAGIDEIMAEAKQFYADKAAKGAQENN